MQQTLGKGQDSGKLFMEKELTPLKKVLSKLKTEGKILLAILFGSYAQGVPHKRSDIDLAVYINTEDENERFLITDEILMSIERDVNILRLDDEEESPFVVQAALKGMHLVEPDVEALYNVARRALHETEGIRFRRSLVER